MELDKEITGIILFWIGFSLMVFAGTAPIYQLGKINVCFLEDMYRIKLNQTGELCLTTIKDQLISKTTIEIMFYLGLFVIIAGLILFWIGQKNEVKNENIKSPKGVVRLNEDIKILIEKVENLHREIRRIEAERVKESIKRWIDKDLNGDKNG